MQNALIWVPFLSLAAVCLALARIGRRDGHGLLWRVGALAAAVPPVVLVLLVALSPVRGVSEQVFLAAFLGSVYLSAPLAAVMAWVVAVAR
ncbi:MAG: hypothetical protein ACT4OK_00965 [Gemmobacter sp.]